MLMNQIRIGSLLCLFVVSIFMSPAIAAQEASANDELLCKTISECNEKLRGYRSDVQKLYVALEAEMSKSSVASTQVSDLYNKYYAYQASIYDRDIRFHTIQGDAFEEQATNGWVQLVFISILMTFGLVFAGIQLWFGVKYGAKVETSENSIELGKLSFKSSVMGITVLFIWLIAYFLYVEKIYPIDTVAVMNNVQNTPAQTNAAQVP